MSSPGLLVQQLGTEYTEHRPSESARHILYWKDITPASCDSICRPRFHLASPTPVLLGVKTHWNLPLLICRALSTLRTIAFVLVLGL